MKCPNCQKDLINIEKNNLSLDFCSECKGIWFDAWEWEDFAEAIKIDKENFNELVSSNNNLSFNEEWKRCPVCNRQMEKIKAYGLIIDRCIADGGIWFDGKEFLKVLDVIAEKTNTDKELLEKYINQICYK